MKSKRYFQLVERDSSEVSLKWKVCHVVLFICIAVNSAISFKTFHELVNTFECKCLLYTKPVFIIEKIGKLNKTEELDITIEESITELSTEIATEDTTSGILMPLQPLYPEPELFFSFYKKDDFYSKLMEHFTDKITGTNKYYLMNNSIYFKNESMYGQVNIKTIKIDSPSILHCDFIFFILLFSLISSSVFAGIVIIYGKGGRGYPSDTIQQGWRYVYILLIVSVILFISFMTATNFISNGTEHFCRHFVTFTGQNKCNSYIDYFTMRTKWEQDPFYTDYLLTYYAFVINTCLWAAQLIWILFRVLSVADFQFNDIVVQIKKTDGEISSTVEDEEQFQKIHEALKAKERLTKVDPTTPDDEESDQDQTTESTVRV